MAQVRSDNILADLPKVLDDKTGVFDGSPPKWRPYNDVAEFTTRFPAVGRAENQMFWVRNDTVPNNADLYSLRKDKTPYLVFDSVDLSNYYTISQVNDLIDTVTLRTLYKRLSGDGVTVVVVEELEGADLVDVIRGSVVLEVITTGSPLPDQVLFDVVTGTLTFGSPFTSYLELVRFLGYNFLEIIPGTGTYYVDGYIADGYTV